MEKLTKPFSFTATLIIIYLGLLALCIAIYALIQIYVGDKGTATNLMIWSATLFPSIALLYTFNAWRYQKGTEVIAEECKNVIYMLSKLDSANLKTYSVLNDPYDFNETYNEKTVQPTFENLLNTIEELEKSMSFINICLKKSKHISDDKYDNYYKRINSIFMDYTINYNNFYEKLFQKSVDEESDIQLAVLVQT